MEFKISLIYLKKIYNVNTNKELANALEITESAIDGWTRRKTIPNKYYNIIREHYLSDKRFIGFDIPTLRKEMYENCNTDILEYRKPDKIHRGSIKNKIIEELENLTEKQAEYFYHLIKAETLKDKL